jgi:hypothetical protein
LALRYYVQTFNALLTTNLEHNGFLSGVYAPFNFIPMDSG